PGWDRAPPGAGSGRLRPRTGAERLVAARPLLTRPEPVAPGRAGLADRGRRPGDRPSVPAASHLGLSLAEGGAVSATTAGALAPSRAERPSRLRALLRGRADDPAWARPALIGLLAATAALYLVDLAASGYANAFYSAAVEAGSKSWKAFFFGS